jgi:transposase-like protein
MPKKTFSPKEIISKLREAEVMLSQGQPIGEVCRALAISEQRSYRWRKEYGRLRTDQARRLKELERENARLKNLVAELALDKAMLNEALSGKS